MSYIYKEELEKIYNDLKVKKDIEEIAISTKPLLYWALYYEKPIIAEFLIKNKVNLDLEYYANFPIFLAIKKGYTTILESMLKQEVNTEVKDFLGRTPIFEAIEVKSLPVIKLLAQYKANLSAT